MAHLEHLVPDGVAPPRATYSHAIRSRGDVLWLAGQVPVDEDGQTVGPGDPEAQLRQAVGNVERILRSCRVSWMNIVRLLFYVVGAENVEPVRIARKTLFSELYPDGRFPTSTFLVVDGLTSPGFLVEVEAKAAMPDDRRSEETAQGERRK